VASAASIELRATSRFPRASTTAQYFGRKVGLRLLEIAAGNHQWRPIGEKPAIPKQGLRELETQRRTDIGIENVERVVGVIIGAVQPRLYVGAGLKSLRVVELRKLRRGVDRGRGSGALKLAERGSGGAVDVVGTRQQRIERRVRAQQREFRKLDLRFLNPHKAVVFQREHDCITQAERHFSIDNITPQVLRRAQFVGAHAWGGHVVVCLALLRPDGRSEQRRE
jgi:hypothetical protein